MKREHVFIAAALGVGLVTWLVDASVDCLAFRKGSFWDLVYGNVPPPELYGRSVTFVSFLAFGLVLSVYAGRRKKAEEALARSSRRYKELADSIADVFFAMDSELRYTYWNKASEKLTGIPAEEAIGRSLYELFPDVAGTGAEQAYRRALETQQPQNLFGHYRLRQRDTVFDISAYPSAEGLSVFVRDVTERRRTEEKLRQSEERLRTVFEAAKNVAFVTTDLGGEEARILDFSPGAEAIFGYRREEAIGRPLAILHTPEQVEDFPSVTDAIRGGKTDLTVELELVRKSGQHFSAILTTFPIFDDGGNLVKILGVSIDITGRKEAEEALRNSEREKAAILDSISELLVYRDAEGKILSANRAAAESAGLSPQGLVGKHCYELWPGRDSRCPACPVARAMDTGRPETAEMTTPDGRIWHVRGDPVRDDDGNIVGCIEAALDITERKRAERALRESEVRYRTLFEQAVDSIVVVDSETGAVIDFNEQAHRNLGYTAEEFAKLSLPDIESAQSAEEVRSHRRSIVRNGSDSFETKHRTKDGRMLDVHVSSRAISIGQQRVCQSVWRDITERTRAEQALRESEERYRRLFERAPIGIGLATPDGRIVAANAAMEAIMGYSVTEMRNIDLRDTYVDSDDRRALLEALERTGSVAHFPAQLKRKDATPYDALLYVSKVRLGDQELFQTMSMDVTERNRLEEKLRREEEALQQAARLESLGKLAGGVAHDFNNLMTGIIGYGKLLLDDLPSGDPHRRDVEEIGDAARRAAALTEQLLAFGRRRVLAPRALNLNGVVSGMGSLLERVIGEDVELVTALHPGLGLVHADPSQLEEVIMNLAVNARDAMPEGGTLSIETSNVDLAESYVETTPRMPTGQYVRLTVRDTGCGMDEETLGHLFEPFFTTKAPGEGTGLGLATAYGIVKQHDGYIWAQSAPGKGTTFRICLPRFAGEAEAPEVEASAAQPEAGGGVILVIEDEESVRRLVHRVLSDNGYTVLTVGSADEAERVMARHGDEIALLLTDVVLPDRSGPELRADLTEERPALKALYMSGYAGDRPAQRRALEEDLPFLAKPFSPDDLLRAVCQALDRP